MATAPSGSRQRQKCPGKSWYLHYLTNALLHQSTRGFDATSLFGKEDVSTLWAGVEGERQTCLYCSYHVRLQGLNITMVLFFWFGKILSTGRKQTKEFLFKTSRQNHISTIEDLLFKKLLVCNISVLGNNRPAILVLLDYTRSANSIPLDVTAARYLQLPKYRYVVGRRFANR